jgi:hypothetical protein
MQSVIISYDNFAYFTFTFLLFTFTFYFLHVSAKKICKKIWYLYMKLS